MELTDKGERNNNTYMLHVGAGAPLEWFGCFCCRICLKPSRTLMLFSVITNFTINTELPIILVFLRNAYTCTMRCIKIALQEYVGINKYRFPYMLHYIFISF